MTNIYRWNRTISLGLMAICSFHQIIGSTPPAAAMHIAEGYLPVQWAIFWWVVVITIFSPGFAFADSDYPPKSRTQVTTGTLWSLYIRFVCPQNPFSYWELFAPHWDGTGDDFVWPASDVSHGGTSIAISSGINRTWWLDNLGCEYVFDG